MEYTKPKAFKCVCEETNCIAMIFAKSKKSARKIFASLYKLGYNSPDISIKRVKELDYLNREDGYVMQSCYKEDWIALLKIGYTCKYSEEMADYCEYCDNYEECLEMIKEEKEYEK